MQNNRGHWNDQVVEKMKGCIANGLSGSQTAEFLNKEFNLHFTRNAIIGKMHRAGLCLNARERVSPEETLRRRRERDRLATARQLIRLNRPSTLVPAALKKPTIDLGTMALDNIISASPVTLLEMSKLHCGFMIDELHYCGNACGTNWRGGPSIYCDGHHRVMHRAPMLSRKIADKPKPFRR